MGIRGHLLDEPEGLIGELRGGKEELSERGGSRCTAKGKVTRQEEDPTPFFQIKSQCHHGQWQLIICIDACLRAYHVDRRGLALATMSNTIAL